MSPKTRNIVRGFAQRMIGPEILEETADAVVLQDVVGANPLPIPSVIRRMHQMVRAMQTDAMAAFHARDLVDREGRRRTGLGGRPPPLVRGEAGDDRPPGRPDPHEPRPHAPRIARRSSSPPASSSGSPTTR